MMSSIELGKFLGALTDEMEDRKLPLWISLYINDLIEASIHRMREASP